MGEKTLVVGARGFGALLIWARDLDGERVWALEDCRHVAGSFERFLIARGERVLRVPTKLMADSRRAARTRGKSDSIDAIAVARAALREGIDTLPAAHWTGPSSICGCWSITASAWSANASESTTRSNGTCTISGPSWSSRAPPCSRPVEHPDRPAPRARRTDDARPDRSRRTATAARTHRLDPRARGRDLQLVTQVAPQLLSEPGFGPRTAAKLVGEIAGAGRFATDAKLARAGGLAPIPVSSGKTSRHRLDRGGNRQINAAIHRVAVTRARCHPETRDYVARKLSEGKTHRDAIRSLKRHLARRIWRLPQPPAPIPGPDDHTHCIDIGAARAMAPTRESSSGRVWAGCRFAESLALGFPSDRALRDPAWRDFRRPSGPDRHGIRAHDHRVGDAGDLVGR